MTVDGFGDSLEINGGAAPPGRSGARAARSGPGARRGRRSPSSTSFTSDGRQWSLSTRIAPAPAIVSVIEYFTPVSGITSDLLADEIAKTMAPRRWTHGRSWKAWSQPGTGNAGAGSSAGLRPGSSHFYTSFDFRVVNRLTFEGEVFHVRCRRRRAAPAPQGWRRSTARNESRNGVRTTASPPTRAQRQMIDRLTAEGWVRVTMCAT
jgi:hypothetical protein